MHVTIRGVVLSLVVTSLVAGPLAPLARAQAPQTAPTTSEGDLFQESMKNSPRVRAETPGAGYQTAAVLADIFYVPGKALICTAGVGFNIILLGLTFGSAYRGGADVMREGCGGKWYVSPEDLRPAVVTRDADWEDFSLR